MKFSRHTHEEPEINLIPFIDVLLVILIFLMLSTTYSRFAELKLELPTASAEPMRERPGEIVVGIDAEGRYSVNRKPLEGRDVETLAAALAAAAGGRGESLIVIAADALTPHQAVVTVMDAARRANLQRLSFATQAAGAPRAER